MEKVYINGKLFFAKRGALVSRVLQEAGEELKMPCAGAGRCGKCRVRATGALSLVDSTEKRKLTAQELEEHFRLACRARVLGECRIDWKRENTSRVLLAGQAAFGTGKPLFEELGAAIDVGTTTIAAQLYDKTGLIAQAGMDNPQAAFGADVVSRMEKSLAGEGEALTAAVRRGICGLLKRLGEKSGRDPEKIDALVITGNTCMLYLLAGRNPKSLSRAPFEADWLAGEWLTGAQLDLPCRGARVWLPPCISAFVGADITTALLAVGIRQGKNRRLLVDIGTNGEIALWKDGEIFCCSTAAGPAFEGAGLRMGMQGEEGAIAHVWLTERGMQAEVIGGTAPRGICGSGVIDAVSCLRKSGAMDDTGYLAAGEADIAGGVRLVQEDIRKVQLAKSAICAGIRAVAAQGGLEPSSLEELLIAGGFGSYLELENALAIGLLPPVDPAVVTVCGNAALYGAAKLLLDEAGMEEAEKIVACARPGNLAEDPFFQDCYIKGMLF